jgi:16S rRNA (cytosine1402-N4)-methyltransferase
MSLAASSESGADGREHVPVMAAEVVELLSAPHPRVIVDATVGTGGHALALLGAAREARLVGIDRDGDALVLARERLLEFAARVELVQADFAEIGRVMREAGIERADAIVADLGMSSFALDDPERGFSFRANGPLDMRMDRRARLRAYDIVNEETEEEIVRIIRDYGEERKARRVTRGIVEARRRRPIATTAELRAIVERALGPRRHGGMHPATRTFQALRIAVNNELESLAGFLNAAPGMLAPGGRLAVIAYHSLEDRAVKERFRELARLGEYENLTAKVIKPSPAEVARNPRARSARLRCLERVEARQGLP